MKDEYLSTRKMMQGVLTEEKNGFSPVFSHALKRKANKQRLTKIAVYSRLKRKDNFFSEMANPLETFYKRRPNCNVNECRFFFLTNIQLISLGLL